jgi:uncharacterized membrane protein YhhN
MMPFPGGIESTSNATLLIALTAAVLYGLLMNTRPTWLRTIVKTMPAVLLAVLVAIQLGPLQLAIALALSAIGDAILSREDDSTFIYGLGCFLAAHLAFIPLFFSVGQGYEIVIADIWRAALAVVLVVVSLAILVLLLRSVTRGLRLPMVVYVFVIIGMGLAALTTSNPWVIGGAVVFILSDAVLATEKFLMPAISPHRDWMRVVVWVTYVIAQVALTLGFVL